MSCKLCDFTLEVKDRKVDINSYFEEDWWIECKNGNYNLAVEYDCGYAVQFINNIKYCPICGRKLSDEQRRRQYH